MVKYVPMYDLYVESIHSTKFYQDASDSDKQKMDQYMSSEEVKKSFGTRVTAQLTLHESFIADVINSDAMQQRSEGEQKKIIGYVESKGIAKVFDGLEKMLG